MTDKYTEVLQRLTASDQVFAFKSSCISLVLLIEFINAPKTLPLFEFGLLFQNGNLLFLTMRDIHIKTSIRATQTANALKDAGVKG